MAPLSAAPEQHNLQLRIFSAIVILSLAIAAIWLGGWTFSLLIAVIGGAMCWEWAKLSAPELSYIHWIMVVSAVLAPVVFLSIGFYWAAAVLAIGWAATASASAGREVQHRVTLLAGLPYVGGGLLAALWLRTEPETGLAVFLWLVAIVVATDVGAYFVGRTLGGPKLAPAISPKKTWSGLLGGAACAGLVSLAAAFLYPQSNAVILVGVGIFLALVAQCGDLLESAVKRRSHAKDASNLIPGHGGFLDRFDGYLTVMPTAALMAWATGGSPLIWQ